MSGLDDEFFERARARARSMTHAESMDLLKSAGVLDENGRLAERYRPDRDHTSGESRFSADSASPGETVSSDFGSEFRRRAIEWLRSLSVDESIEVLESAGVLDADGRLAERYRPDGDRDRSEAAPGKPGAHRVSGQR